MSSLFCTITVPSTIEVPDPQEPGKTFTSYNITCVHDSTGRNSTCVRRFHEFREFDRVWTQLYPTIAERVKLPSTFAPIQTKNVIDKRRIKLQEYLVQLAEIKAIQPLVAQFLGVSEDFVCAPRGPKQENLPDIAIHQWRGMEDAQGKIHGLGREQQNANDTQTHGLVSVEKDGETYFVPSSSVKRQVGIEDMKIKNTVQRGNTHDASERARKEKEEFLKKNAGIIASLMPGRQLNFAYNVDRAGQTNDRYMGRVHISLWYRRGTGGQQRPVVQDGFEDVGGGCLVIEVHSGMDLPSYDGITNPYCKLHLLPDPNKISKKKTSSKQRTVNPTWEEVIEYKGIYPVELAVHRISISIWDKRTTGKNHCVGEVVVKDLMNLPTQPSNKLSRWIELGPWSNLSLDGSSISVNQLASTAVDETISRQAWASDSPAPSSPMPMTSSAPAPKPAMPSKPPPKLKPVGASTSSTATATTTPSTTPSKPPAMPASPTPEPARPPMVPTPPVTASTPTPPHPSSSAAAPPNPLAALLAARQAQTAAAAAATPTPPAAPTSPAAPTPPPAPKAATPPPTPKPAATAAPPAAPTPPPAPVAPVTTPTQTFSNPQPTASTAQTFASPPPRPTPTPAPKPTPAPTPVTQSTPTPTPTPTPARPAGPDLAAILAARQAKSESTPTPTPTPAPRPAPQPQTQQAPSSPVPPTSPTLPPARPSPQPTPARPSGPDLAAVLASRQAKIEASSPTPAQTPAPQVAPLPSRPAAFAATQTTSTPAPTPAPAPKPAPTPAPAPQPTPARPAGPDFAAILAARQARSEPASSPTPTPAPVPASTPTPAPAPKPFIPGPPVIPSSTSSAPPPIPGSSSGPPPMPGASSGPPPSPMTSSGPPPTPTQPKPFIPGPPVIPTAAAGPPPMPGAGTSAGSPPPAPKPKPTAFTNTNAFSKPPSSPSDPSATSGPPAVPRRVVNLAAETNAPVTIAPQTESVLIVKSPVADPNAPPAFTRPPPKPPAPKPSNVFKVILDYSPTAEEIATSQLIALRVGEEITVIDRSDEVGWWYGSIGSREGYFPGTYVTQA